jgi:hypothetical protein
LLALFASTAAAAPLMGWYMPLHLGASWTYQNEDPPFDIVVDTVFELIEYEGHPAYRFGSDVDDHSIAWSEQGIIRLYAVVDTTGLYDFAEDVVLDEVIDGDFFVICFGADCDSSLIRVWAELDPSLRTVYGVDPGLTDMVVFASYDPAYPPNLHNIILESNLPAGVTPPAGAVTGIDLYLRNIGLFESWDVDADSGGLFDHYVLTEVSAAGDGPPTAAGVYLEQVAPNPFNPRTTISYRLTEPAIVTVAVYDAAGRLVRELQTGAAQAAGVHRVVWDGADARGRAAATGVYLCRIVTGKGVVQAKLCLVR